MFTCSKLVIDCVSGHVSAFLNLVGGSVLTLDPAGVATCTCMREGPIP